MRILIPATMPVLQFIVAAETHPMCAFCPVHIISPLIGARMAILRDIDIGAGDDAAEKGDLRTVYAETYGRVAGKLFTFGLRWLAQAIAEVGIGEAVIID